MGKLMIISFHSEEEKLVNQIMELLRNDQFEVSEHTEESIVVSSKIKLYLREHRVEIENKNLYLGRKQFALLLLLVRSNRANLLKKRYIITSGMMLYLSM